MQDIRKVGLETYRPWEELIPDALALIFSKMSLQEVLTVIPRVCKSWQKVAARPDCWQEIDIEEYCRRCKPENTDRMISLLVSRSRGSVRKIAVSGLRSDSAVLFIAKHAHNLQVLRMPMSDVTDNTAIQVAPKLSCLTYLDISCCKNMTSASLEALGKHCKALTHLSRNMHPLGTVGQCPRDDEAFAIANYMSGLKHLELAYGLLTNEGIEAILGRCKHLEHLDIRGCWHVNVNAPLAEQCCSRLRVFRGPIVDGSDDLEGYHSYDDDYSDSTCNMDYDDYNDWEEYYDFDDYMSDGGFAGVQLRVYDGVNSDDSSDWPSSPGEWPTFSGDQGF